MTKKAKGAKIGRPVDDVPADIASQFVEWIAQGKTASDFCRQDGMPTTRTIERWRIKDADFASEVARAKDAGFDAIADECLRIADTPLAGEITTVDEKGTKVVTEDMLGHRKLQVETRLKLLACWDPRRYGNKVAVGGDASAPPIKVENQGPAPAPSLDLATQMLRAVEIAREVMQKHAQDHIEG